MPVATLLGLGAVAVFLAAVVAVFVRQPDGQRSSAHRPSPPAVVRSTPTGVVRSTPTGVVRSTPTSGVSPALQQRPTAAQPAGSRPAAAPRHHVKTKVLGETAHRAPRGQAQALPFTGPAPIVPTSAIGLLTLAAGSWLLVRWPACSPSAGYDATLVSGSSVTLRSPLSDGAIERLRFPGHQFARPSSAATDGTRSERTTNVSSSSPAVTANPVS
jgi:hypothetical protein